MKLNIFVESGRRTKRVAVEVRSAQISELVVRVAASENHLKVTSER